MAKARKEAAEVAAGVTTVDGLLDSILESAPSTVERSQVQDLVQNLIDQALQGSVVYQKTFTKTINAAIKEIDAKLSKQLSAVLHAPEFQRLEGSWRGLNHLVMKSETCATLKLKVLHVTKKELQKDLEDAVEFDMSETFKQIYTREFGQAGGEPFGALIGDYEFNNHPDDVGLLSRMSEVAAAGFCPFISAASPRMFGFDSYTKVNDGLRDLEKIFLGKDWIKWREFREKEDSRFVVLTMPRVLARLPYGAATRPIDEFEFEEVDLDESGNHKPVEHEHYTWMNAAYALGARFTDAFSKTNWCTAIRGYENGGVVEDLPVHVFTSEEGDREVKVPTEVLIPDRRDAELSKLGFLGLVYHKNSDKAIFIGGQTTQKPKKYDDPKATSNAALSARLPYIMASGRIAHYLKILGREKLGSFMERADCEKWLNRWISQYVLDDPTASADLKARYPLAEAQIVVEEIPGKPGAYNARCLLRPWLQLEELNAAVSMVASIPAKA
jgi:type VI secretion system protein ImpC